MSEEKTLDLRGLSCPEPAIKTKNALKDMTGGKVEVMVDAGTARDNVERVGRDRGWEVTVEELPGGGYRLSLKK
ncbi:MAG: sulfurtransferase TusA family protein [Candidatus Coatesbacteria bacterium]|nr:MAG: sulfurtransferase TusA family protein [Candidatus Coatesbacteria bacterium]